MKAEISVARHMLALLILFPVFFVISVIAQLSALKFIIKHNYDYSTDKKAYRRASYSVIPYPLIMVLLYFIVPLVIQAFTVVIFFVMQLFSLFAALIIIPYIYRIIRAIMKRRACIKRLKLICSERGYTLSEIRSPYLSIFKWNQEESFCVSVGDKKYSCKFIAARRKNIPFVIRQEGIIHFYHNFKIRGIQIFSYVKSYDFDYESEHKKILIINPVPSFIRAVRGSIAYEVDNGDIIGNYKVFSSTGFLNALDRDCLDRTN